MRFLTLTLLLLSIVVYVSCVQGPPKTNDQTWGVRTMSRREKRVHNQTVRKAGSVISFGQKKKEIRFPAKVFFILVYYTPIF